MPPISLFDYQADMLGRISAELARPAAGHITLPGGRRVAQGRSVMVQMPTGTGKTYVMAAAIKSMPACGEVWVIAHRRELVEQMERTLARFGICFSNCRNIGEWGPAGVRVMSIQWLSRHVSGLEQVAKPALVVIDEAHHSLADSYQSLWAAFPQAMKLGFTATPCRMGKVSFRRLWNVLLCSWSVGEFIAKGRLSPFSYVVSGRDSEDQIIIDSFERRGTGGDYSISEMAGKLNRRPSIMRLYAAVDRYARGRKGIVYAIDIAHARSIALCYRSMGLRAEAIDSRTPADERSRMVDEFRRGAIDCIVNVNLFDEGFDCPDVGYIQLARPTLSLAKYMQMVGRGLRAHPGKEVCVIIDNVGLFRLFGRPDAERGWMRMFRGREAGRGTPHRRRDRRVRVADNEMELVAVGCPGESRPTLPADVEPFEKDGRWGLRAGGVIVLRPVYRMITPFVGNYCAYMLAPGMWGVLDRGGRPCVPPEYKKVELLPGGEAILTRGEIYTERVRLG